MTEGTYLLVGFDVKGLVAGPEEDARRWQALEEGLNNVCALAEAVHRDSDQWLFGTAQGPGYADFVLAAAFVWFKKVGPEGGWDRLKGLNEGRWRKHMSNVEQYMAVV